MRRRHPWPAVLLTLGLVLAGCAGAAPPTATPTASPTAPPTATPTTAPTATPTEAPPTAADLCADYGTGENEAPAGEYLVATTDPAITLTLPGGYTANCAEGSAVLFGPDGIIAIIAPVGLVAAGGVKSPVEPTIEAVSAAVLDAVVDATDAQPVEIGGFEGVEFVVTVDESGVGLRSPADRGWGFNSEENETGGFTLVQLDGAVVGFIRHGDDPLAVGDDVMASIQFESD